MEGVEGKPDKVTRSTLDILISSSSATSLFFWKDHVSGTRAWTWANPDVFLPGRWELDPESRSKLKLGSPDIPRHLQPW